MLLASITINNYSQIPMEFYWIDGHLHYVYNGHTVPLLNDTIGKTLANLLKVNESQLTISELNYAELPNPIKPATSKMYNDLLDCKWTDYALDNMTFQCALQIA